MLLVLLVVGQCPLLHFIGIYVFVRPMDCAIPAPGLLTQQPKFHLVHNCKSNVLVVKMRQVIRGREKPYILPMITPYCHALSPAVKASDSNSDQY